MIEIVGWLVFYTLALAGGWAVGWLVADWREKRHRVLSAREAKLQAEWRALLTAQRLNAAFMEARRAMWEEAIRHQRRPDTP